MKNTNYLLRYFLIYSALLLTALTPSSLWAQEDCHECQESLIRMYRSSSKLIDQIEALTKEKNTSRDQITSVDQTINTLDSAANRRLTATNDSLRQRVASISNELASLRQRAQQLQQANNRLIAQNHPLELDTASLWQTIRQLRAELGRLEAELREVKERLAYFKGIVDCIDQFQKERSKRKRQAKQLLEKADLAYEFYTRNEYTTEGKEKLRFAWQVYSQTEWCRDTLCDGYPQNYCDDYKSGLSHLYRARIVANNEGNVLNGMAGSVSELVNKANEILLSDLGAAIRKGVYNNRSDTEDLILDLPNILERLPDLILTERKGSEADSNSVVSSETFQKIKQVSNLYQSKRFAEALSLYSKCQRFIDLDLFEKEYPVIARAKFSVGAILLWDMNNISKNRGLVSKKSWLDKQLNRQKNCGRDLLQEVVSNKKTPIDIQKKAHSLLKKQF